MHRTEQATRILLVEDEPMDKKILVQVLKKLDQNLQITWAATAEDAIDALHERSHSLVLSDAALLGTQSGFDLWDYCQEQFPTLPFLMISGIGREQFDQLAAPGSIAPLFLAKPLSLPECRELLRELLGNLPSPDFAAASRIRHAA